MFKVHQTWPSSGITITLGPEQALSSLTLIPSVLQKKLTGILTTAPNTRHHISGGESTYFFAWLYGSLSPPPLNSLPGPLNGK